MRITKKYKAVEPRYTRQNYIPVHKAGIDLYSPAFLLAGARKSRSFLHLQHRVVWAGVVRDSQPQVHYVLKVWILRLENTPPPAPPPPEEGNIDRCHLKEKYEKGKRKRGKCKRRQKKKER